MLMFRDNATGEVMPFRLFVLGTEGSGRRTVVEMMRNAGVKLDELNHLILDTRYPYITPETVSHTLYVSRPSVDDKDTGYDPMMMHMIDNSEDLDYLQDEVEMFVNMLNFVEVDEENPA